MKHIKRIMLFSWLVLAVSTTSLLAQNFTVLHDFIGASEGSGLSSGLLLSGNTLFGTSNSRGSNGFGTIFSVNTDGAGFTVLHTISNPDDCLGSSSLILSGTTLFATSRQGGRSSLGTVFSAGISNGSIIKLHTFTGLDGSWPSAGLVLADNQLYGTTVSGGTNNSGTLFSVGTNGSGFTVIHQFSAVGYNPHTNTDGAGPAAALLSSGNTLYGTTSYGGTNAHGTVFRLQTDGSGFTTLHHFTSGSGGDRPEAGLILSGEKLYGTTSIGGTNSIGTVFSINTNGTGFTVLHSFGVSDGSRPKAGLVLAGDTLFGTTSQGGANQRGTVFMLNTNGSAFRTLHDFTGGADGADPLSGLILSGSTLYGAAHIGGTNGNGTVYALSIVPGIRTFSLSGTNLVINATNGLAGHAYTMLMATNVILPISQWVPVTTEVFTSSGNFTITVTNAVNRTAPQRFYVLKAQ